MFFFGKEHKMQRDIPNEKSIHQAFMRSFCWQVTEVKEEKRPVEKRLKVKQLGFEQRRENGLTQKLNQWSIYNLFKDFSSGVVS